MAGKRRKQRRRPQAEGGAWRATWRRNRGVIRAWLVFVLVFVGLLVLFHRFAASIEDAAVVGTAHLTAWLLWLMGLNGEVDGRIVTSSIYKIRIIMECTAVFPLMVFVAAVIAYPCRWGRKLFGLVAGIPALLMINEVRLVSLFFIGNWYPRIFDTAHLVVWQSLMIFFTLVLWLYWAHRYAGERAAR